MSSELYSAKILLAYELLVPWVPVGASMEITELNKPCHVSCNRECKQYSIKVTYISHRTGRKIALHRTFDDLPRNQEHIRFYAIGLVLDKKEIDREFRLSAWRDKKARQDSFLSAGKLSNIRVALPEMQADTIPYDETENLNIATYQSN